MVRYGTVECGVWCCVWFLLKIDHLFFSFLLLQLMVPECYGDVV